MRLAIVILFTSFLSSCLLSAGNVTKITTLPAGALVRVNGVGECETPCTVELTTRRHATVAKAGYKSLRIYLEPGGGDHSIALELAAPTKEVDAITLPDLN